MKLHEKIQWLKDRGELWINPVKIADVTGTWTDGSHIIETNEFYAVDTLLCKVQHHLGEELCDT